MSVETAVPKAATRYPGVGPRAAATLIDATLGFLVIGLPLAFTIGEKTTLHTTGGTTTSHNLHTPGQLSALAALAIVYYVVFEATLAATPGKLVVGLRVYQVTGERCTWRGAIIRNLVRVVDAFPYVIPYLAGAISIWSDDGDPPNRQRIGDRAADTVVTYR